MKKLTFKQFNEFVGYVVNECFAQDEDGNDIGYYPEFKELSISEMVAKFYFDFTPTEDLEKDYEYYLDMMEKFTNEDLSKEGFEIIQYYNIIDAIEEKIEFRKAKIISNSKSEFSEIASRFNIILDTINSKLKDIDPKKLEKFIGKLNPDELVKAYNRSGTGNKVRDDAISQLVSENKELKNQINAKNVVSDNVVNIK